MLVATLVNAALAALAAGGLFVIAFLYEINAELYIGACRKLLLAGQAARFEKLQAVLPPRVPLGRLVSAAWHKRDAPAPIAMAAFAGYREAQHVPSYTARMKEALAPELADAHRRIRRALVLASAGLPAPVVAAVLVGPAPLPSAPWLLALGAVALWAGAWVRARKLRRDLEPALDALLPLIDDARRRR